MNKITIRTISLVLVAFYVISIGGYYLVYFSMQVQAKYTMHNLLANKANWNELGLERIAFDNNTVKISDEFTHREKRYDAVYSFAKGDSLIVYCVWDKNEESIVDALNQYQLHNGKTANDNSPKGSFNILKLLQHPALLESFHQTISVTSAVILHPDYSWFNNYSSEVPYHPPKISLLIF